MLSQKIRHLKRIIKQDGVRVALRRVAAHLNGKEYQPIQHYEFILGEEQGLGLKVTPQSVLQGSMTWLIPDFEVQSGGHINILRMIKLLKERGFPHQHVVIMEPFRWSTSAEAQAALDRAFGAHGISVSLGVRSIKPCTFLVATAWQTAYWVSKYKDALHRLYFVQDFEPAFYPYGSDYAFAENTYRLGLTGITAGSWLAAKLSTDYGMKTFPYSFACDTELYKKTINGDGNVAKQIFFYARPVTPRRCFEIGLVALKKVIEAVPDASVVFAGWNVKGYDIPFRHIGYDSVPITQLPGIYSRCDVALILSGTNLSLLPLEVAACGCPLVLNNDPHSNWLLSKDEANYCDMSVESISDTIINVLRDPASARKKADAAFDRSQRANWKHEADKVAGFISSLNAV